MRNKTMRVNISNTQYPVISAATKSLGWSTTLANDWDILWRDGSVSLSTLSRMKTSQKINHFPGMYEISRKNCLAKNLNRFRESFPVDYDFYPETWILPQDIEAFKLALNDKNTLIIKPEASSQGKGIFLVNKIEEVKDLKNVIGQRYINNPLLIDGLKFDLRIYVLVAGCDPLRVYIHEEGLARFATEPYAPPDMNNLNNRFMHLTNYAVNKHNEKFVQNQGDNEQSHKRSLSSILKKLEKEGRDSASLWDDICDIIIKTLLTAQPFLATSYKSAQSSDYYNGMCFEVLGFDILIDSDLRPWLLEVNFTPSFTTDSPLDLNIKKQVIADTLRLISLPDRSKQVFEKVKTQYLQKRTLGKRTAHENAELRGFAQEVRDAYETQNRGGFIKIYPDSDYFEYTNFLKHSQILWAGGFSDFLYLPRIKKPKFSESKDRNHSAKKIRIREKSPSTPMKTQRTGVSPKRIVRVRTKLSFSSMDFSCSHSRSKSYLFGSESSILN
ncbi:hypothetical protein SteCoe_30443 [Stentor coeruleus]|uniref:Tubulin--tyrosine ligase-like protein 9 n=1 Tax=Stentor coeruleus TaxID=5963 RepID=A0A1R2B3K0_9CILI|nr:hypothetical protein SteCoe_30443 [Stentor coeruleus]